MSAARAAELGRCGPRAFSLVEVTISMVLLGIMFAGGMAAAGVAARDRQVQAQHRRGVALARALLNEIVQQKYADATAGVIGPRPGVSLTDRSNWKHIGDYAGFTESPPRDRWGGPIAGAEGWTWGARVGYMSTPTFAAAGASTTATSVSSIVAPVTGTPTTDLSADAQAAASDTGLKRIVVTVVSPTGRTTTLSALRTAYGSVDRVSTGMRTYATVDLTVGADAAPVRTGAQLLNTPAP